MSKTTTPGWQDNDALLTYRVGPVLCCGPTLPIITITPPPALTHLPGTNIAEPGIFKHGNYIVSATDLRYRFGVKQEDWKQPGQVIIAQHGDLTRGYFVDEIKDVIHFPQTGWGQLPSLLPRGIFSRTLLLNKQIYLYTEFEKLSQLQGSGYLAEYISQLEALQYNKNTSSVSSTIPAARLRNENEYQSDSTTQIQQNKTAPDVKKDSTPGSSTPVQTTGLAQSQPLGDNSVSESSSFSSKTDTPTKKILKPDALPIKQGTQSNPVIPEKNNSTKSSASNLNKKQASMDSYKQTTNRTAHTTNSEQPTDAKHNSTITHPLRSSIHTTSSTQSTASIKYAASDREDKSITAKQSRVESEEEFQPNSNKLITPTIPSDTYVASTPQENKQSSFLGTFLLLLLIIIGSGGGYYYISQSPAVKSLPAQSANASIVNEAPLLINQTMPADIPESSISAPVKTDTSVSVLPTDSETTEPAKTDIATTTPKVNLEQELQPAHEYHASIKQDNNTITIELDGPLPPEINTAETSNTVNEALQPEITHPVDTIPKTSDTRSDTGAGAVVLSLPTETSATETSAIAPTKSQHTQSREIIHIIVKGDTLWAIAKRYLLNPYRYPELAKLSKIKNPDLIYPGNRVRIIYTNSKNRQKNTL